MPRLHIQVWQPGIERKARIKIAVCCHGHEISGVARVYPAPQGKNIFAPPPTKTAEFEVENMPKNKDEAKAEYLC